MKYPLIKRLLEDFLLNPPLTSASTIDVFFILLELSLDKIGLPKSSKLTKDAKGFPERESINFPSFSDAKTGVPGWILIFQKVY
ncbi:hypothetical protein QCB49_15210 (plasmid) [Cetobacterium somerae]|uniref:hypothetical protein n=1 Tax=Cetobacterium somerae TaxID=188913 RepID=UPI00389128D6